jgi:PAS domain S-box-containing protein
MLSPSPRDEAFQAKLDQWLATLDRRAQGSAPQREFVRQLRNELPLFAELVAGDHDGESEQRYRNLFNAIDEGFCTIQVIFDEQGRPVDYRFLEVNPAFEKQTGLIDAAGKYIREMAPEQDAHWFEIYGRVAVTGQPIRFENHSAPIGRWFDVCAVRFGRPEQRQVALLFSDVTARKQAEHALRESEERFRAVADNIPQLAWMTNAQGDILWFNRRWFEYTGKTLPEMQAAGWASVHHPDHPARVGEGWLRALVTGLPWEDTFPVRRHDGEYRWFLSRAFPIHDHAGKILRWFGTNTDITQLRETEEALRRAHTQLQHHAEHLEVIVAERTAKLRDTVQELEAFSYSLTHDMRAPLRAMSGFSHILETEYGDRLDDEGRSHLKRIAAAAGRLDQLIRDVLAYSKVVREDVKLHPIDTGKLVSQLVEENPALQPPKAEIIVQMPLHPVLGHEAYLMQIVSNLVYNAVKFVAPGRQPQVRIWTEPTSTEVKLLVQDNGIGIPSDVRQRLFGMFQRFHSDKRYEGTGIGLAIVRKAAERMGGSVHVESQLGHGSTFIVRLRKP